MDRIFQPDEQKLVGSAIGMAQEHTLYRDSFGYPNQFISKIATLMIIIYSRICDISIEEQAPWGCFVQAYYCFRLLAVLISTGTIVVSYLIGNKLHKQLGVWFALAVALYPEYILMAKQVTGDATSLFLIAPNMLWEMREAVDGIVYMYSYDKDGVTPYMNLLRKYMNHTSHYAGIGFMILLLCGIVYMTGNYTK